MGGPAQYFDVGGLLEGTDTQPAMIGAAREPTTADDPAARLLGTDIGPWRLELILGRGASAVVFQARHLVLARGAAVKVLRQTDNDPEPDFWKRRMLREAATLAKVEHPNLVEIYDSGMTAEGAVFLVLELVGGQTLRNALRAGIFPPARARRILGEIAAGLEALHAQGIVHRDLKPENVLIREGDAIKIVDFGLSRDDEATRLTKAGTLLGTPLYMSPEQVRGGEITPAVDLYALGAIGYWMLSGGPPFPGSNAIEVMERNRDEAPRPLPDHGGLGPLVLKLLSKKPADRGTSSEVVKLLLPRDEATRIARVPKAPPSRLPLVAVALLLSFGLGWGAHALLDREPPVSVETRAAVAPLPEAPPPPQEPVAPAEAAPLEEIEPSAIAVPAHKPRVHIAVAKPRTDGVRAELAHRHLVEADLDALGQSERAARWRDGDPDAALELTAAISAAPIDRRFLDARLSRVLRAMRGSTRSIDDLTPLEDRFLAIRKALSEGGSPERVNADLDALEAELTRSARR